MLKYESHLKLIETLHKLHIDTYVDINVVSKLNRISLVTILLKVWNYKTHPLSAWLFHVLWQRKQTFLLFEIPVGYLDLKDLEIELSNINWISDDLFVDVCLNFFDVLFISFESFMSSAVEFVVSCNKIAEKPQSSKEIGIRLIQWSLILEDILQ